MNVCDAGVFGLDVSAQIPDSRPLDTCMWAKERTFCERHSHCRSQGIGDAAADCGWSRITAALSVVMLR